MGDQTLDLVVGIVFFILIISTPFLIVAICIITIVVCIFNKHCPLYSQRQSQRWQPPVGVLVAVDCQQDNSAKYGSTKYQAIETPQGRDLINRLYLLQLCLHYNIIDYHGIMAHGHHVHFQLL